LCLNTTVDDSMNIKSDKITGPLTMYPPADDNYSEDACSILVMDTIPPSVVIASNFGELYNCLLLPDTQAKVSITHSYFVTINYNYFITSLIIMRYIWDFDGCFKFQVFLVFILKRLLNHTIYVYIYFLYNIVKDFLYFKFQAFLNNT